MKDDEMDQKLSYVIALLREIVGPRQLMKDMVRYFDNMLTDIDCHLIVAVVCRHDEDGHTYKTVLVPVREDELPLIDLALVNGIRKICDDTYGKESKVASTRKKGEEGLIQ